MPAEKIKQQSLKDALSLNHLSGKIIWALALVVSGILLMAVSGFGLFASNSGDNDALDQAGRPLQIEAKQVGLAVVASANKPVVSWGNAVVDSGGFCGPETFAVPPNHPSVSSSNTRVLPAETSGQVLYRNKWVCFEAVDTDGRSAYRLQRLDLGNPIVTIRAGEVAGRAYLQGLANEAVSWRALWFPVGGIARVADGTNFLGVHAYSQCESYFVRGTNGRSFSDIRDITASNGRVFTLLSGYYYYCFEAVDTEGNRTYLGAYPGQAGIYVHQSQAGYLYASFHTSSAAVEWFVVGSLNSSECNASVFEDNAERVRTPEVPANYHERGWGSAKARVAADAVGKYYCFRAEEPLGSVIYKSVQIK